jgi:two-component system LytT family sensor kinase
MEGTRNNQSGDWALAVILLFWMAEYLVVTAVDHLAADTAILFLPRILIALSGLALSFVILRLRGLIASSATASRLIALILFALLGGFLQTSIDYIIFRGFAPEMREQITATVYFADTVHWFWIYAAQLGMVFALDYSRAVADRERRIAVLDRMAQDAKLRALRYQLNPHFMFNTLNSIATLVGRGDSADAERMIEDLSDFLRATLAVDPNEDISLARELELQERYLAIETRRFPRRLQVEMDVDSESSQALVPSLITQPLTENVIRHAVATSRAQIRLTIRARRVADQLHLSIINSLSGADAAAGGTKVGLANVAERLRARFDSRCAFIAGPQPDGGFAAIIQMPHRMGL